MANKKLFLTGASGFVGRAVVPELLKHGYTLTGLARSEASQAALGAAGVTPIKGDLESLDVIRQSALEADGVIHLGFIHDFNNFAKSCEIDRAVINTVAEAYLKSDRPERPFLITSGTLVPGVIPVTEETRVPKLDYLPRGLSEHLALDWAAKGVHVGIVRLPPTTHGKGDHGFSALLCSLAKLNNKAAYVGEGENHWCAVHRDDAAVLYRLAIEKNKAGAVYHAVGEPPVKMKDIETTISKKLNVPLQSITAEELSAYLGSAPPFFNIILPVDNVVEAEITKRELGWTPKGKTLLEELSEDYYYETTSIYV